MRTTPPDEAGASAIARSGRAGAVIPHPPYRIPIVGDVIGIDTKKPSQTTLRRFDRLGPIYRRTLLGIDITFVGSAELAAPVFDESVWRKHVGPPIEKLRFVAADGLFTAHDDEANWARAHEVLTPGFMRSAMRLYHDTMSGIAAELLGYLDRHDGARVDVVDALGRLTFEAIARCGFSSTFDMFERDTPHPIVVALAEGLQYAQTTSLPIPVIGPLLARRQERGYQAGTRMLTSFAEGLVHDRIRSGERHEDLLDCMLYPSVDATLDPINISKQILTFLVAGHESSNNTLAFALHYLAQRPDVVERAREEIRSVAPRDGRIPYEHVAKLRYLRQIISEAMRLWPAVPVIFREARVDTMIGDYAFSAGEWVLVSLLAVHRDPGWGPDPSAFDPERFAPAAVRARPAEMYKPFGVGPRACIGRQFALHEMTLALAAILDRYDLDPEPDYEFEVAETLTLRPYGLRIGFVRRPDRA